MSTLEVIKFAAVKTDEGWIIFGKSHACCFRKAKTIGWNVAYGGDSQGFLNNKGQFLVREQAAKVAYKSFQINKETPYLFSEDLWSKAHGGKYKYDEIEGYVLEIETNG